MIPALNVSVVQGDPLGDGTGGESIWGGEFEDEFHRNLRHDRPFTLSMANGGTFTLHVGRTGRVARMSQIVELSSDFSGSIWITVQHAEKVVPSVQLRPCVPWLHGSRPITENLNCVVAVVVPGWPKSTVLLAHVQLFDSSASYLVANLVVTVCVCVIAFITRQFRSERALMRCLRVFTLLS